MYCRNCGKQLPPQAKICPGCGVPPPKGERFCNSCGTEVSPLQEKCMKCGALMGQTPKAKSKTKAILLAVFLSIWTWLYTYKKSARKFWSGVVLWLPSFFIIILGPIPVHQLEYNAVGEYVGSSGPRFPDAVIVAAIFVYLGLWILAIIDVILKKEEWYWSYNWTAPPKLDKKE